MTLASILVPITLGFAAGNWSVHVTTRRYVPERVFYGVLVVFAIAADAAFIFKF